MDALIKEPTEYTPKVVFDLAKGLFEISGDSRPENTRKFYRQIYEWMDKLIESWGQLATPSVVRFKFAFDYINSSSNKFVLQLLLKVKALEQFGVTLMIEWYYDEPDTDMREIGEEYIELTGLPINLVSLEV